MTLNQFGMGRIIDSFEDRAAIQEDLGRLEKWTNRNFVEFCKDKCLMLHLGRNNPLP